LIQHGKLSPFISRPRLEWYNSAHPFSLEV
jgi:hypothetical protein